MRAERIAAGHLAESLFKRLLLDNHLTPLNPIALKCSLRARVHKLVLLLSPLSASNGGRKREIVRDGEGGLNSRTRCGAARRGVARSGREGTREFIEVSLIPRG